jgi:hypothetical protein
MATMTETIHRHYEGGLCRELVLEAPGTFDSAWRVYWAIDGRCRDARSVQRFRTEGAARRYADVEVALYS